MQSYLADALTLIIDPPRDDDGDVPQVPGSHATGVQTDGPGGYH